jgi:hypothetical protein
MKREKIIAASPMQYQTSCLKYSIFCGPAVDDVTAL